MVTVATISSWMWCPTEFLRNRTGAARTTEQMSVIDRNSSIAWNKHRQDMAIWDVFVRDKLVSLPGSWSPNSSCCLKPTGQKPAIQKRSASGPTQKIISQGSQVCLQPGNPPISTSLLKHPPKKVSKGTTPIQRCQMPQAKSLGFECFYNEPIRISPSTNQQTWWFYTQFWDIYIYIYKDSEFKKTLLPMWNEWPWPLGSFKKERSNANASPGVAFVGVGNRWATRGVD